MSTSTLLDAADREQLLSRYTEIAAIAGGLAHEIRNPLSTISLNLELLAEEAGAGETPRDRRMLKKIQTVQRECGRLETLLDDFLQFARAGELELVPSDLNAVVGEFVEFYQPDAEAHGVEISPHLLPDLPTVRLDPALFRQVLVNLARNAQQAMPEGGLLELQTSVREGQVQLDLIDTGCGMDEKTLSRVFDVFFSTKPKGSGLGLPTVKKIVEMHGGRILAESAPGRGSRFSIRLPYA